MKLFTVIEDIYYSIYRIQFIDGQNNGRPSKFILYFQDNFGFIELGIDEIDTHTIFCDRYNQLCHIPAPIFNIKTWGAFVKMLYERAQVVDNTDS